MIENRIPYREVNVTQGVVARVLPDTGIGVGMEESIKSDAFAPSTDQTLSLPIISDPKALLVRHDHGKPETDYDDITVSEGDFGSHTKLSANLSRNEEGQASLNVSDGSKAVKVQLGSALMADGSFFGSNLGKVDGVDLSKPDFVNVYQDSTTNGTRIELSSGSQHVDYLLSDRGITAKAGDWAKEHHRSGSSQDTVPSGWDNTPGSQDYVDPRSGWNNTPSYDRDDT